MNLTDQELEQLKEARQKAIISNNWEAWDNLVNEIKAKRNGEWPPDWYQKVIANPDIDTTIKFSSY